MEGTAKKKDAGAQYLNKITAQDLIEYAGVRQEIAGRIQQIVQLHPMTEKDFRCILKDKKISPVRKLEKMYGVTIHLEERTERKLARGSREKWFRSQIPPKPSAGVSGRTDVQ